MADSVSRDLIARQTELQSIRAGWEPVWEQVADFCAPDAPRIHWQGMRGGDIFDNQASRTEQRTTEIYDATIVHAVDRLVAGLESLITPQSDKWHGLTTAEFDDDETDEEREWAEGVRDFLFQMRYQAGVGFVPAMQSCYRNVVRFGPAYLYTEEAFDRRHVMYRSLPVPECYIARDQWGNVDTFHRLYLIPIRQLVQKFGMGKLPERIRRAADDPVKSLEKVEILQVIQPRSETGSREAGSSRFFPFASYHVLTETNDLLRDAGFRTFPIATFNWGRMDGDDYGTSPCINALTTVREINAVRKTGLRALQQITDPATASAPELDFVPTLNPGTNYPGLVNANGQQLIVPINSGQNPGPALEYAQTLVEVIKDATYVNLFQVLISNPKMTATEALIRQEEKGSLLGPAGSVIQSGLAMLVDRELSILEAKGIYEEGSRFVPPASLAGKEIRVSFTSPLDVLRKSAEARDTVVLMQSIGQLAGMKPEVIDNVDGDEVARVLQSAGRAPQKVFLRREEVEAVRQQRAQAQQAQLGMAAVQQGAQVAKDGVPALVEARDAGLLDGTQQMMQAAE